MTPKDKQAILEAFEKLAWKPTGYTFYVVSFGDIEKVLTAQEGESELVRNVFGYIIDDNNYLPGHDEIVISMPHEMFEDILAWWLDKESE